MMMDMLPILIQYEEAQTFSEFQPIVLHLAHLAAGVFGWLAELGRGGNQEVEQHDRQYYYSRIDAFKHPSFEPGHRPLAVGRSQVVGNHLGCL